MIKKEIFLLEIYNENYFVIMQRWALPDPLSVFLEEMAKARAAK